ncbi:MAG: nucleotidyltransferase family protein [Bacteroidia bacterium]
MKTSERPAKLIPIAVNTREDVLMGLKTYRNFLNHEFQVTRLGLFGSFARGEQTLKSDIDLLVEFEPNTPGLFEKKRMIKDFLQQIFQREIDLCREKYIKSYFRDQILKEALYV